MEQAILDYVKQARASGAGDEQIHQALLSAGWLEQDIQTALRPVNEADGQSFVRKWSWGGFLLYAVYFIGSRNYKRALLYFLGTAVPVLNVYLWVKAGLRGRKMVWESGKWADFSSYQKRQKLLDRIGVGLFLLLALTWAGSLVWGYFNSTSVYTQPETPEVTQEVVPSGNPMPLLSETSSPSSTATPSPTPKPSATQLPQSSIPLEIVQATLSQTQLTYPFSGITLKVLLRNNTAQQIKEYNYRFFLDEDGSFGQYVGNELAYIDPGTMYEMESNHEQGAISELAKSCDFFGLNAGQYHIHLKISTDTNTILSEDTTGPQVTDKLIPFTLTSACQKK